MGAIPKSSQIDIVSPQGEEAPVYGLEPVPEILTKRGNFDAILPREDGAKFVDHLAQGTTFIAQPFFVQPFGASQHSLVLGLVMGVNLERLQGCKPFGDFPGAQDARISLDHQIDFEHQCARDRRFDLEQGH